ncbi:MAG TPA: hypothetical protein PLY93_14360 [Turneriella sp.]|nr:hypothetical protein [Turneriella sp.]
MQTLGEILKHDDPAYLRYLSRKTQYLITREKSEYIHQFWRHLIVEYHPQIVLPALSTADKKTFETLLKNFGHDENPTRRAKYQKLEKKIPWVFEHPNGGHFIPYEIIKTLMPQQNLISDGYLFQLLYAMPKAEQNSLRALMAESQKARDTLTSEKHPLDRALALYIYSADQKHFRKPKRTPHARTLWQYLGYEFPKLENEIREWQYVMQNSQKGFYRSLALVRSPHIHLLKSYTTSLWVVPVTTRRNRVFPAQNLRFVIPLEFLSAKNARASR